MHNKDSLHGTRIIRDEPIIDQAIFAVPDAFKVPTTQQVLELTVTGYNHISTPVGTMFALGGLATRTLNAFFSGDPERSATLTTSDLQKLWASGGIKNAISPNSTPQLRGVDTLDAIRVRIDGDKFVHRSNSRRGQETRLKINPDIIFIDER